MTMIHRLVSQKEDSSLISNGNAENSPKRNQSSIVSLALSCFPANYMQAGYQPLSAYTQAVCCFNPLTHFFSVQKTLSKEIEEGEAAMLKAEQELKYLERRSEVILEEELRNYDIEIRDLKKIKLCKLLGEGGEGLVFSCMVLNACGDLVGPYALKIILLKSKKTFRDVSSRVISKTFLERVLKTSKLAQKIPENARVMGCYSNFRSEQEIEALNIRKGSFKTEKQKEFVEMFFKKHKTLSCFHFDLCEYVPGLDFIELVEKEGLNFSYSEIQFLLANITLAVEHLHKHGIAHRDVKMDNFVFDAKGYLKLVDFGLVKETKKEKSKLSHRDCGTPFYMAPEVAKAGEKPYKLLPVDLWSIGVVLYCLVANHFPYRKISETPSYSNTRFCGEDDSLPIRIKSCIQQLLIKDPDERLTITALKNHSALREISNRGWEIIEKEELPSPLLNKLNSIAID
jgi:serine/threonine protein kinase